MLAPLATISSRLWMDSLFAKPLGVDIPLHVDDNQEKNNQQDWTKVTILGFQKGYISLDRLIRQPYPVFT